MSAARKDSFDADAYLNPIVQSMRFADVPALFEGLDMVWVAVDYISCYGGVKGIDLGGTAPLLVGAGWAGHLPIATLVQLHQEIEETARPYSANP